MRFRSLENAAGDPAVALIEAGVRALEVREAVILRLEQSLQVGGIVDRMRPGVARQEFEVARKTLGEICRESVINGVSGRLFPRYLYSWEASGIARQSGK